MYLDGLQGQANDTASFLSPTYTSYVNSCLNFYYFMHGSDLGFLQVDVIDDNWNVLQNLTKWGDQGQYWFPIYITIPAGKYRVKFSGVHGAGPRSDIDIDDIRISAGPCNVIYSGKVFIQMK